MTDFNEISRLYKSLLFYGRYYFDVFDMVVEVVGQLGYRLFEDEVEVSKAEYFSRYCQNL